MNVYVFGFEHLFCQNYAVWYFCAFLSFCVTLIRQSGEKEREEAKVFSEKPKKLNAAV